MNKRDRNRCKGKKEFLFCVRRPHLNLCVRIGVTITAQHKREAHSLTNVEKLTSSVECVARTAHHWTSDR